MQQRHGTGERNNKKRLIPRQPTKAQGTSRPTNPQGASCIYNYTIATPRKSTTTKGACFYVNYTNYMDDYYLLRISLHQTQAIPQERCEIFPHI